MSLNESAADGKNSLIIEFDESWIIQLTFNKLKKYYFDILYKMLFI